ncbi:8220_t:CDS:2, partial [Gigaspora margarita]
AKETDIDNRKTARRKCKHCGDSIINLIDRLKNHLMKYSEDFNVSSFDHEEADTALSGFFLFDKEFQDEQPDLDKILENTSTITLISDGWSNIRRES